MLGLVTTYAKDRYITDSAAAGTALATGNKTSVETIAMDAARKKPFISIAKMAKQKGLKVGIISTANINDATPAVFYANQPERSMHKEISADLVKSGFDLFGGGYTQKADVKLDLKKAGYIYADTKKDIGNVKPGGKYMLTCPNIEDDMSCRFAIDQKSDDINLADLTKKGTELLDNPNGFFMMIEGGKIDWALHANDAATALKEIIDFDGAISKAIEFYNEHPEETLIVVIADHETGGFGQGSYEMKYDSDFKKLDIQKLSSAALEKEVKNSKNYSEVREYIKKNFGVWRKGGFELSPKEEKKLEEIYAKKDPREYANTLTRIINPKVGINWTTASHTGMPVAVFAKGNGQEMFRGYIDNTDVAKNIIKMMELK